jgi:dCMP deaminase
MTNRKSWENYFMDIAHMAASRSTCGRKNVGAIIVKDRTIVSTGYNGSIRNAPHCDHRDEKGLVTVDGEVHCDLTVHAEMNAIVQAAKNGVSVGDADIYITASPCWPCFKNIANAGIKTIYYAEFYRDEKFLDVAMSLGIDVHQID